MKSRIALLATIALASTAAWAGYYQPAEVTIEYDENFDIWLAGGDMTTAANSNNDVEFIGCGARTYFDDVTGIVNITGFCQARDADGNRGFCSTRNTVLIDAMRSIDGRSYITFSWVVDETPQGPVSRCLRVGHSTQSFYQDKIKPSYRYNGGCSDYGPASESCRAPS